MALIRLLLLAVAIQEGFAPHYAKGLMAEVSRNRDLPIAGCMVSSPTETIGTWLYVYGVRTGAVRHCRVTDVSQDRHRSGHIRRRMWVELSFEVTRDLCGTTTGRSVDCPVIVIRLEE